MPILLAAVPRASRAHTVSYRGSRCSRTRSTSLKLRISRARSAACLSSAMVVLLRSGDDAPRAAVLHNRGPSPRPRSVNQLFVPLGIEAWKPVLTALLLPPVPFLVGIL